MGNANRKAGQLPDQYTGLTENEVKLIQQTWRNFCKANREYGVLIFLSMFVKHPEYLQMFKNFRGKHVAALKDDPAFRAHGCSIGYHLTSMVESLRDPETFEVLVRRNATEHLRRKGVKPYHFEVMGQCLLDVLQAKDERHMTPTAIEAWKKFLTCMVAIMKDVYIKDAVERAERGSIVSALSSNEMSHNSSFMDEALLRTDDDNIAGGVNRLGNQTAIPVSPSTGKAKKASGRVIAKKSGGSATVKTAPEVTKVDVNETSPKTGFEIPKAEAESARQEEKGAAKGKSADKEKSVPEEKH